MKLAVWLLLLSTVVSGAAACGDDLRGDITIVVASDSLAVPALTEYVALTPGPASLALSSVADAGAAAAADDGYGWRIVVVGDPAQPAEGYVLAHPQPRTLVVRAADPLGAQYGVSEALEDLGFRFRHPTDTLVPTVPALAETATFGVPHAPEIRVRGVQFHTLHPIEGYFALWEPSAVNKGDAHRTVDWLVKNRGNFLQWPALNDILDPAVRAAWQTYERDIIDDAHMRGIRVGIGIEMFGSGNLQLALDLIDDTSGDKTIQVQIAERLHVALDDLPWDVVAISYGEFFDEPAQDFVDANNALAAELRVQAPTTELHAIVHVGATQRVVYQGEDIPYYFLVKFADPSIIPDIHSVMYYDLFQPAGGAYQQSNFDEHRQYIVNRMCSNQKVSYFPELAYWVAFDNSVPTFMPLYVRSRWLDLQRLPTMAPPPCGKLDAHYLFSSGDEWGYWLQNVTALHDTYEHARSAQALFDDALVPDLGVDGAKLVGTLASAQNEALITGGLAPYMAGRDAIIDAGRALHIVSQPDRVTFDQLPMMAAADLTAFDATVLTPLAAHADELDSLSRHFAALGLADSRWVRELQDGLDVDRLRARFVTSCYRAVLAHLGGDEVTATAERASAAALLVAAQTTIAGRHGDLHDTHGARLTARTQNHTSFGYGYLFQADSACYWRRELAQVDGALGNATVTPPDCFL